jgi:hypothetical protein
MLSNLKYSCSSTTDNYFHEPHIYESLNNNNRDKAAGPDAKEITSMF